MAPRWVWGLSAVRRPGGPRRGAVSTPSVSGRHPCWLQVQDSGPLGSWGCVPTCGAPAPAALSGHQGGHLTLACSRVHAGFLCPTQRGHQRTFIEALKRRGARPGPWGALGPEVLPWAAEEEGLGLRPRLSTAGSPSSAVTGDRGGCWESRHCQRKG